MVFSSSVFLFAFMPLFFAAYFLVPGRRAKNALLLAASLLFYAWGEPVYVLLMLVSIVANWAFGLVLGRGGADEGGSTGGNAGADGAAEAVESAEAGAVGAAGAGGRGRRGLLVVAVAFNVAVIGFFKYEGFLSGVVNGAAGFALVPDLELPLPIGISFYTLQALSYVIDVYRGQVKPQRNLAYLGMYISCFPQLIAGPIVRYADIQAQVVGRKETLAGAADGMRLFAVGLAKKALLANTCAILADKMLAMGGPSIGAVGAWAGLAAYTFQIFFDFSGYSDMAVGLGRMMGFTYLRNFNYPYVSRSITEFWRRWHMSLSSFFRDYLYIPLGGSRVGRGRHVFNILAVWAVTGLWHGAAWNFVGWGVYYGLLLVAEKYLWGRLLDRAPRIVGHLYTIAVFTFGWSFFWIGDGTRLVSYWQALAGAFGSTGTSTFWELTAWEYWPVFAVCALASTPLLPWAKERLVAWAEGRPARSVFAEGGTAHPKTLSAETLCVLSADCATPARARAFAAVAVLWDLVLLGLFVLSVFSVVSGSFNPFIYFQF